MGSLAASRYRVLVLWIGVSAGTALTVLAATLVASQVIDGPGSPASAGPPFVRGDVDDAAGFLVRNAVVACLLAVLAVMLVRSMTARQAGNVGDRGRERWRRRVVVTAAFGLVAVQVYRQGHSLAWMSAYVGVPASTLLSATLPHAVLELTAVVMPLTAAALGVHSPRMRTAGLPSVAAALTVAIPLLAAAAVIETYVSPRVYQATACTTGGEDDLVARGGCQPCPRWAEAAFDRAVRLHERVPANADKIMSAGCTSSTNTVPPGFAQPAPPAAPPTDRGPHS